ncbi:MFS transporter [Natrinema thermotolerans]
MSSQSAVDDDPIRKLVLAIGFLAVSASAFVAHTNPATGYELSIYTMTPWAVWAGLLVALSVSLAVAFVPFSRAHRHQWSRSIALVLGGLVMVVFVGLPIVRGYRFYGHYDALTHLGWARGISEGTFLPFELFYPGIHTVTVLINATVGIALSRSMLFVVFFAVLLFCLFVPLCVGVIVRDWNAVAIAAFSAFLLLPITTISMNLSAHAMSQAVLFSSVLLYLFAKYLRTDRDGRSISAVGVTFALGSAAVVLYHPQLAAHLLVAFVAIGLVQFLARRADHDRASEHPALYGQVLFLAVVFLVWSSNYGFFAGTAEYFLGSVIEFVLGTGGGAGDTVATQGTSLASIGGSLSEIFFKLFFPSLVFSLLAGGLVFAVAGRLSSQWLDRFRLETTYLAAGLVALGPVFVAYFLASGSKMYFRVFGLMMVFVTVLGAIAIHGLLTLLSARRSGGRGPPVGRPLMAVAVAVLLVLSLLAVFPSPYIYKASPHVSEQELHGYESAFATQQSDLAFVGLRNGPNRYDDAINGNEQRMHAHDGLPPSAIEDGVSNEYEGDRYLALTRSDYEREVIAYQGLRYSERELDRITASPNVNRVQSNGEFTLYYVTSSGESEAA